MIGKRNEAAQKDQMRNRPQNDSMYKESCIQLDRPIQSAILGTTTIVGKQKNE